VEFGILTVTGYGIADGGCGRITPQVFTRPVDIAEVSSALQAVKS